MSRHKTFRATTVWVTAAVLSFAGAAATAQPAFAKSGGKGGGGNNGAIKIHDGSEKNPKSNNPHLTCPIIVSFAGFDDKSDSYTTDIHTISPSTKNGHSIALVNDNGSFVHSADVSYTIYDSQLTGAKSNKGQYHVYVHVTVQTSNGSVVKNKAVWLTPCASSTNEGGVSTLVVSASCVNHVLDYAITASSTKDPAPADGSYTFTPAAGSASSGSFGTGTTNLTTHAVGTLSATYDGITKSASGSADCAQTNDLGSSSLSVSATCVNHVLNYAIVAASSKDPAPADGSYSFTPVSGSASSGSVSAGTTNLSTHAAGTLSATYDGITKTATGSASCASTGKNNKPPVTNPPTTNPPSTPPTVLGEKVSKPVSNPVKVLGQHFTKGSKLPFTGPSVKLLPVALLGAGLLFLGLALTSATRRKVISLL